MTSVSVSPLARVNKHKRDWRGWKFMWPFALVFVFIVPIFAVCCLFPFVSMLINATKTQSDFTGAYFGRITYKTSVRYPYGIRSCKT